MKRIICFLLMAVLFLPAVSLAGEWRGRGGGRDNYSSHRYGGDRFWPILGAVIVGGVVLDALTSTRPPPYSAPRPPSMCYSEIYGAWRVDRFGNRYWYEFSSPRRVQIPCW